MRSVFLFLVLATISKPITAARCLYKAGDVELAGGRYQRTVLARGDKEHFVVSCEKGDTLVNGGCSANSTDENYGSLKGSTPYGEGWMCSSFYGSPNKAEIQFVGVITCQRHTEE